MAANPSEFSVSELANIFDQSARASNREWQSKQRELSGIDDFELPPAQSFLGRSPVVNFARQALPENLGATQVGSWVADQAQRLAEAQPQLRPHINRAEALAQKMPLGGWSTTEHRQYHRERKDDANFRRNSVEVGMVPTADNRSEVKVKGDIGARTAQAAGVVAGDVASDGLRNIWWFVNAPQALANLVADETVQREGYKILDRANEPILKNRATRMAATLPAVLATSFGIGNVMREEGYKAVLPSEGDPRQSENALAEAGSRYFLGRTGGLLPYNEFVKERPDVSKEEYYKYKTYLHNKNLDINPLDGDFNVGGVVKGTVDGIHGPEVSFLGKSIPALTGLVPIATAVAGSRRGLKRAGTILNKKGTDGTSMVDKARSAGDDYRTNRKVRKGYEAKLEEYNNNGGDQDPLNERPVEYVTKEMLNASSNVYNDAQRAVERVTLENALAGGGIGALGGGVGATALESVIRSLKPTVSYEEEV